MNFLKFTHSEGTLTINVTCSSLWSCLVVGNFQLSKYSGSGDDVISIIIPENIQFGRGTIRFSYGKHSCSSESLYIYENNPSYFNASPSEIYMNGNKSASYITVNSNSEWLIDYFDDSFINAVKCGDNMIMVLSKTDNDFTYETNNYTPLVIESNKSKKSITIKIKQNVYDSSTATNALFAEFLWTNDTTIIMTVTSLHNKQYCDFSLEYVQGLTFERTGLLTVQIVINDSLLTEATIQLYNDYTSNSYNISLKYITYTYVGFDIANLCNSNNIINGNNGKSSFGVMSLTSETQSDITTAEDDNASQTGICD